MGTLSAPFLSDGDIREKLSVLLDLQLSIHLMLHHSSELILFDVENNVEVLTSLLPLLMAGECCGQTEVV